MKKTIKRWIAGLALAAALALAPGTAYADPQQRLEVTWEVVTFLWYLFGSIQVDDQYVVTSGDAPSCDVGFPYWCEIHAISYCSYIYFDDGSVQGSCGNF
jgi:hypothetical protein